MTTARSITLQLDTTRIHALEQGEGPLVLLVHGFPELSYSWRHQLSALAAAGYRAVAIDQRGYGRSSKFVNSDDYRIDYLVADLVGVVQALGESNAVVVGHDWGAPVAWTAAWLHPDVFHGVVGISVPFSGPGIIALPGNPFGEQAFAQFQEKLAGPGQDFYQTYFGAMDGIIAEVEADVRGWFADLTYSTSGQCLSAAGVRLDVADPVALIRQIAVSIPHGARMRDRFSKAQAMTWMTEADIDVYADALERSGFFGPFSFYRNLPAGQKLLAQYRDQQLTVPALFIGGEYDVATWWGVEAREKANELMSDYRGEVIIEGAGHWIQQEMPEHTNEILLDFLRGL